MRAKKWMLPAVLAVAFAAGACAPREVIRITGTEKQLKLVYAKDTFFGVDTGVVRCKVGDQGKLKECSDLPLEFLD